MKDKTYIIAEAGVNHNGDILKAVELIIKAKESGADCVKFQTFKASKIATSISPKAEYQLKVTDKKESQLEMLKKVELTYSDFEFLNSKCKELKIDFMSTPYSFEDIDFLSSLDTKYMKIASGQLSELEFIKYACSKKKKLILSTGMATLSQVSDAVEIARRHKIEPIILQCTTNYPSKIEETNLLAMKTMEKALNVKIGYSDHVLNNYACFSAVALGATVIEKHFTLSKNDSGPDHSCSSEPNEFKELVYGIRQVEKSIGSSLKQPSISEKLNEFGMKRSLVVNNNLEKGDVIKVEHIDFKRPKNGLDTNYYSEIIGKKLRVSIKKDTPLQLKHIDWC